MLKPFTNKIKGELKKDENAYLTVYLSLIFAVVLSLLLALIEGAAISALRLQADITADLGLDSVFAEYNREILNQYELFFIDSSYGGRNGGTGMVHEHLSDYISYNINPVKSGTLLKLTNPYLQIDEVSYATDDNCIVWKAQAVNYMKSIYGGDLIAGVKEHMDTIKANGLNVKNTIDEISDKKTQLEHELAQRNIIEYGDESKEGYSYVKVSGLFDKIIGKAFISLVFPSDRDMSAAVRGDELYLSDRLKNGKINKGVGLYKGVDKPNGITDELIYNEYIMKMYGSFAKPKATGRLKYQAEYIINGKESDAANLRACVMGIFTIRAAANLITISKDSLKKKEVEAASIVICALLGAPDFADLLTEIILGIWALAEAVSDIHILLEGGKAPLIKESKDWNVSLIDLFGGNILKENKKMTGMSYDDYLRVFLGIMNKNDKTVRSLDIVEMDIRMTPGNEAFRIDRCIDYMKVNFGFEASGGHAFLFKRLKCY